MPPRSSLWRMADRLAGGELEQILLTHRDAGLSAETISARLYGEHGIEVTGQTVRAWLAELDDDTCPAEATG